MTLSEEDKKRIVEEEKFRAETRNKLDKKKGSGCLSVILLGFLLLIVISAFGSLMRPNSHEFGKDILKSSSEAALSNEFKSIAEKVANPAKLEIQDNWKWIKDGNYLYVRGRVKNTGNVSLKYWKVTAKYLDKAGNVINQDIDNSTDLLLPNDSDEFEVMTKYNKEYKNVTVEVTEAH